MERTRPTATSWCCEDVDVDKSKDFLLYNLHSWFLNLYSHILNFMKCGMYIISCWEYMRHLFFYTAIFEAVHLAHGLKYCTGCRVQLSNASIMWLVHRPWKHVTSMGESWLNRYQSPYMHEPWWFIVKSEFIMAIDIVYFMHITELLLYRLPIDLTPFSHRSEFGSLLSAGEGWTISLRCSVYSWHSGIWVGLVAMMQIFRTFWMWSLHIRFVSLGNGGPNVLRGFIFHGSFQPLLTIEAPRDIVGNGGQTKKTGQIARTRPQLGWKHRLSRYPLAIYGSLRWIRQIHGGIFCQESDKSPAPACIIRISSSSWL